MFYDDLNYTNSHLRGASFAIFKERKEIYGGFEIIPLGFNNISEFIGCLKGM